MITAARNGNREAAAQPDFLEYASLARNSPEPAARETSSSLPSLETVYQEANILPSRTGYSILKAAEMAGNPRMAGMPPEVRRNALLMALETAGVDVNFLVADAIARQRALNECEDLLFAELKEFESEKAKEASKIQMELDWLTAQCKARIQASLKEVAREQAALQAWRKMRQEESQRIVAAAVLLAPPDSATGGESLAALLDRDYIPEAGHM